MKKALSLVLAAMMALALCGTAFAETVAYDTSVVVTGLANGDIANFYKVAEWIGDADGNVGGWGEVAAYASEYDLEAVLKGKNGAEATGITAEIAYALAAAKTADPDGTDTVGSDGKAELDVTTLGPGIYMVLITPADLDTVYNPIFVSSDYNANATSTYAVDATSTYSDKAAAKKSETTLEKEASTTESAPDDVKWTTVAIGDTVHFTVTTTIPGYGPAFINPFFKVTDKLTDLTLVAGSVEVTSPTIDSSYLDIDENDDGDGYSIEFDAAYLQTLAEPTEVTIEYDAIVNTDAPLNVNTEKNEVWTEFSHDINNEDDHSFKKDTTQHYTFTLDAETLADGSESTGKKTSEIVKVGVDAAGNPITETKETSSISTSEWQGPLEGAHFKLYRDADCTEEYIPQVKGTGATGAALDIVSGADGRMTIAGLDAGEYWLKEVSAPDGFIMDPNAAHIVIAATTKSVDVTEYSNDGVNWISEEEYNKLSDKTGYKAYTYSTEVLVNYTVKINDEEVANYTFVNKGNDVEIDWTEEPPVEVPHEFVNTQGLELPSTGGVGTTLFYVFGLLMVLGAGTVLVARRKADAE